MHASMIALTPTTLIRCRDQSEPAAPWGVFDAQAWDFLLAGCHAGLQWRVCSRSLDRWIKPGTATEKRRQKAATHPGVRDAQPAFTAGIGLLERHYLGGMTGRGWSGSNESYYSPSLATVPSECHELARALAVFWPTIPPMIWIQVHDLLSVRTREVEAQPYGATNEFAVDQVDALGLYRFLAHCGHLQVHGPIVDWKTIIHPTDTTVVSKMVNVATRKSIQAQ